MFPSSKHRRDAGSFCCAAASAFLCMAGVAAGATGLMPGVETSADPGLSGGPIKVFLPANYSATSSWPVIFFYPGQDQPPQTSTIRTYCDELDYIVIGLPHPETGPAPKSSIAPSGYVGRLRADFAKARAWIASNANTDPNRLFMGGVSKGGWTASLVGEPELAQLAGLVLLLAGRSYPVQEAPGGGAYFERPVYIGDGETDPNMRSARQAHEFFARRKSVVTLEEFPGLGHSLPGDAPRLRAWLQVHGRLSRRSAADVQQVGAWFTNRLMEANATADQAVKYRVFRDLAGDPRFTLCTPDQKSLARDLVTAAAGLSPGREEWAAEKGYRQLLWLEPGIRSLEEMKAVRDGFQRIASDFPRTKFGRLAADDLRLVGEAYEKSLQATRAANAQPTNPAPRQTAPPLPSQTGSDRPTGVRREGNRIIFSR